MSLLSIWLLTLLLAHGLQFLLPGKLQPKLFNARLWLLQHTAITIIYLSALLLTQRVLLSGLLTLTILIVLLVVNQAKYKALREPLVFSDIYLYIQVIHHPRLFLPFLNIPVTFLAIVAGVTLLYLAIRFESPLTNQYTPSGLWLFYCVGSLLLLIGLKLSRTLALQLQHTADVITDTRQLGFFNNLLSTFLQAHRHTHQQALQQHLKRHTPFGSVVNTTSAVADLPSSKAPKLPDIIVIQSESFFDARRLYPGIDQRILENYDQIKHAASAHGTLRVPAWGANTLRTEFAFLSGIDNAELHHYRFNPYQYLHTAPTPTIASYLQGEGYRCIALHPNSSHFFKRNTVFPLLGFETFIDINDFNLTAINQASNSGPYVSDHAVQQKITEITNQHHKDENDSRPLFIFVITMENHGPLHLETAGAQDIERYYHSVPPNAHNDLTVYLRHLANADQMLGHLTKQLDASERETLLCFYGDHVPSMPAVYAELDFIDGHTDYLIWQSHQQATKTQGYHQTPLAVHQLGTELLSLHRSYRNRVVNIIGGTATR